MQHRVRYRECDPMGYVYHTHYLDWFEEARTEALRDMGLAYASIEADGIIMPVVDLALKYRKAARYDELVDVVTRVERSVPTTRVRFEYVASEAQTGDVLVSGHVTLCFFDPSRGRPVRAPERIASLFRSQLAAQ